MIKIGRQALAISNVYNRGRIRKSLTSSQQTGYVTVASDTSARDLLFVDLEVSIANYLFETEIGVVLERSSCSASETCLMP